MDNVVETRSLRKIRRGLKAGVERLRDNGWPVIQTGLAAGLAYFLANLVPGISSVFYAPIAATVCLSLSLGQRSTRVLLTTVGVTVGLMLAYLVVLAIGHGPVQLGVVIALSMGAIVLFTDRTILANQAAISAALVVVLQPPQQSGFSPDRFVDALIGGGVALAVHYLLPIDPERKVERAARPIIDKLVSTLVEIAAALKGGDLDRAERVLSEARALNGQVSGFQTTLTAGQETARFSPLKRGELGHIQAYADAADRLDLAVHGARGLARAAVGAVRHDSPASGQLSGAVLDLARAVQAVAADLKESGDPEDARRYALEAASKATAALKEHGGDLTTGVIVGQIRSTVLDLLIGTEMDQEQALQRLEEAAGRASEIRSEAAPG